MKISVNDQELFTLSEIQKQVIKSNISEEVFDEDMKRRIKWILMHKYDECFKDLKAEWESKLGQRHESIPTNPEALAKLIFSQPDYKDAAMKSKEQREKMGLPPK